MDTTTIKAARDGRSLRMTLVLEWGLAIEQLLQDRPRLRVAHALVAGLSIQELRDNALRASREERRRNLNDVIALCERVLAEERDS